MIEYKGYTGAFAFDPKRRRFVGRVVDLRSEIRFEGTSVKTLEASMRRAVNQHLRACRARGKSPDRPFSGKLNLRLGPELHRAASVAAAVEGESLNAWLVRIIAAAAAGEGRGNWMVRTARSAATKLKKRARRAKKR